MISRSASCLVAPNHCPIAPLSPPPPTSILPPSSLPPSFLFLPVRNRLFLPVPSRSLFLFLFLPVPPVFLFRSSSVPVPVLQFLLLFLFFCSCSFLFLPDPSRLRGLCPPPQHVQELLHGALPGCPPAPRTRTLPGPGRGIRSLRLRYPPAQRGTPHAPWVPCPEKMWREVSW